MKLTTAILLCFLVKPAGHAIADANDRHLSTTPNGGDSKTPIIDGDEPLFDFPISRALGIDVKAMLREDVPRPSIDDLAELARTRMRFLAVEPARKWR